MLRTKVRIGMVSMAMALVGGACSTSDASVDGKGQRVKTAEQVACPTDDDDDSAGDDDSEDEGDSELHFPCAVAQIIVDNCASCHGDEPSFGAPMSLTTLEAFQAPAVSDDSRPVYDLAYDRVTATAANRRMPPASSDELSADDKKTLSNWLKGGAKGTSAGCNSSSGSSSGSGSQSGTTEKAGKGGAHATAIKYDDPLMKCYEFRAFTQGNRTAPYSAPATPDLYVGFTFDPPWEGTQYVRSWRSLIDNKAVLHHWLFFQQGALSPEGVFENALGTHPDGQMLAGWAPGGDDMYLDPDVAYEVPGDVSYLLETHYNNTSLFPEDDASGVELCVTPTPPAHVASLSWVGTDAIFGTEATGHCAPDSGEEVHLVAAQPHMHLKGRHMKVVQIHGDSGQEEVIHDEDFDFNYQRSYIKSTLIKPGDELNTTCTYSDFAVFGKGTNDEMCYFFSIHWPKLALSSIGVGTAIHGVNSCIDI